MRFKYLICAINMNIAFQRYTSISIPVNTRCWNWSSLKHFTFNNALELLQCKQPACQKYSSFWFWHNVQNLFKYNLFYKMVWAYLTAHLPPGQYIRVNHKDLPFWCARFCVFVKFRWSYFIPYIICDSAAYLMLFHILLLSRNKFPLRLHFRHLYIMKNLEFDCFWCIIGNKNLMILTLQKNLPSWRRRDRCSTYSAILL